MGDLKLTGRGYCTVLSSCCSSSVLKVPAAKIQLSCCYVGAVQEALTERYTDQLRELRAAGLSDSEKGLREALKELRDEERAPMDATPVLCLPLNFLPYTPRTAHALDNCV